MPVLTGGQVLDREGTTVMPDWGGALLEGGLYNVGDHGLIEEAEEPIMGMGPYKYSGVPPNGYKNGIAEKGAYLVDILTGDTYRNTGTKAATVWTADAPSGGGSGWSLMDSQDLVAGESSWSFSLPASGKTHARILVRVSATPAHEFGLGIRLNGDTTLSHYAGGDADPAATGLGASWRVLLPAGAAATGLLTIDLPFYRLLPLLGLQTVVRPAGGGVVDQVYWNGATPAATVTLLALENTDDNYAAFAARAVDGGVAELWVA